MKVDFEAAKSKRSGSLGELQTILSRVSDLTHCLGKKEYMLKLESKRPKRSEEDVILKREAGQTLIEVVKAALK